MEKTVSKLLGLPELASKHGADVDKLIIYVHYLMLVLFVGWAAYFLYCLVRFRKARNPKADHHGVTGHASNYLEIAIAIVEVILLVGFAVPLWAKVVDDFPKPEDNPLNIRVTARQFNWMVRYPGADNKFGQQDVTLVSADNPLGLLQKSDKHKAQDKEGADDVSVESGEIAVPVNRPVVASISSLDVIHSFKVLPLRVTQDAIPGLRIPLHFIATEVPKDGKAFQINCAQLCGNGHSNMKGILYVKTQADFEEWLKKKSANSNQSLE